MTNIDVRTAAVLANGVDLDSKDLVDTDLQDDAHRARFRDGTGGFAVTIAGGDKLGGLRIAVQFEGAKGAHEFCMQEQNELLAFFATWLADHLRQLGADYFVDISGKPCEQASTPMEVARAQRIMVGDERGVTVETANRVLAVPIHVQIMRTQGP